MTAVRLFTDDQVKEIVALHKQGKAIVYIAERYGHRATVRKIVAGTAYRDVTHNERRRTCICPSCVNRARDEANFDAARAATIDVPCSICGRGVTWKVSDVLAKHGEVACDECGGHL